MMRNGRLRRLLVLVMMALPFVMPAAVWAQEEGSGAGAAITLSLLGLVFLVIFAVAVVAAVGLGVIGIGYWMSKGDD